MWSWWCCDLRVSFGCLPPFEWRPSDFSLLPAQFHSCISHFLVLHIGFYFIRVITALENMKTIDFDQLLDFPMGRLQTKKLSISDKAPGLVSSQTAVRQVCYSLPGSPSTMLPLPTSLFGRLHYPCDRKGKPLVLIPHPWELQIYISLQNDSASKLFSRARQASLK